MTAHEEIIDTPVSHELAESFLEYSMSVIVSRALPDVRDGLKPVHRRILWSMHQQGIRPGTPYKKCARVVGDCFVAGTLIRTQSGLMPIETIKVGDVVLDGAGTPVEVVTAFKNPALPVKTVTLSDGSQVTVTHGQMFRALDAATYAEKWVRADELRVGDLLLTPGLDARPQDAEQDLEAYVLGLMVAEGYPVDRARPADRRVGIRMVDAEPLTLVREYALSHGLTPRFNLKARQHAGHRDQFDLRITDRVGTLMNAVAPHSDTKRVPLEVLADRKRYLSFLAGYFDGDGYISGTRRKNLELVYATTSSGLAADVHAMLSDLGFRATVRRQPKEQPHQDLYFVTLYGNAVRQLARLLAPLSRIEYKREDLAFCAASSVARLWDDGPQRVPAAAIYDELSKRHLGAGWYARQDGTKFRAGLRHNDAPGRSKHRYGANRHETTMGFKQMRASGLLDKLTIMGSSIAEPLNSLTSYQLVRVASITESSPAVTYDVEVASPEHELVANGLRVHNCIGRYHPHGDSAVYEALVRLAQPWSMRLTLVDGHGNFGSLDDGPAAMRYTECRLDSPALAMVEELSEDTVDMRPNYDGTETEPSVMPAAFPNLLVNGGTGIAVGMATNMAPHNLVEVIAGVRAMIENPSITLDDLMKHIPAPDLPTGCTIVGLDGVREAYETGRGSFKMRATAEIIDVTARKKGIVVTELPFNIGPEKVVARIKDLVNDKKLNGVSDVKDYSDLKHGLRLVIETKTGFNPHAVLDELYKLTPMEESFGINNVALVDGQPQTLGLLDLVRHYIGHRVVVVRRRTEFRLRKAQARAHILEGLIKALANIDEVVALIRSSKDSATARTKLMKTFDLTQVQAEAILEMTLRRLTSLEVTKLKDEMKELKRQIAEYERILSSEKNIKAVISDELARVADAHGSPRRTRTMAQAPTSSAEAAALEVPDDPCIVVLTAQGMVVRHDNTGQKGKLAKADVLVSQVASTNRSIIGLVTSTGRLIRASVLEMPSVTTNSKGLKAEDVFNLEPGEKPVALIDARLGNVVTMATRAGMVKRVKTSDFPKVLDVRPIIAIPAGDSLVGAVSLPEEASNSASIVLVASDAQLLRFPSTAVTPKGMPAGPMAGMRLGAEAHVVAFAVIPDGSAADVLLVSDAGAVKRSKFDDYPAKGRGTGGVRAMTFRKGEAAIACAAVSAVPIVPLGQTGTPVPAPADYLRRDAAGVQVDDPIVGFGFARFAS